MGDTHFLPKIEISYSSGFEVNFDTTTYKFGDGYSQTVGNGINRMLETGTIQYVNRTQGEMETLFNFLKERGGTDYFMWTPPPYKNASGHPNPVRKFKCIKLSKTPSSGMTWNISATFEEVANLG